MTGELVSILIPVYNREKYVDATIESALAQTYENIEVIIVDNCSEDNTWQIITAYGRKDARIKCFRNETNIGPVKNWKRCIELAQGKYGKILWSDDLLHPVFIEKTVPFLADPHIGCVLTSVKIINDDGEGGSGLQHRIGRSGVYPSEEFISFSLLKAEYPRSPGCAVFRLKDLDRNLLVDIPNRHNIDFSQQAIGNDLMIFLLTMRQYPGFYFVDEPLSLFRAHAGSISSSTKDGRLPLFYALTKAYFIEHNPVDKHTLHLHNAYLAILIKLFRQHPSGLRRVSDFYIKNIDFSWSFSCIIQVAVFLSRRVAGTIKKYGGGR